MRCHIKIYTNVKLKSRGASLAANFIHEDKLKMHILLFWGKKVYSRIASKINVFLMFRDKRDTISLHMPMFLFFFFIPNFQFFKTILYI